MRAKTENIAAKNATTTTEDLERLNDKLVRYHSCLAVLKPLVYSGQLSKVTYRKMARQLAHNLGFKEDSIFINIA